MNGSHRKRRGYTALFCFFIFTGVASGAGLIQTVSLPNPGPLPPVGANGDSCLPVLSLDGRFVLFASTANNLILHSNNQPIPATVPARFNVYLRDRTNQTTILISLSTNGVDGGNDHSFPVALSTNGQFALFESRASNLVPGDTNNATDVFLCDIASGAIRLVSASTNGVPGNAISEEAVMTSDGRFVAFVSEASNLVAGDSNRIADVFLRDLQTLATTLVSVGAGSTNPNLFGITASRSESPRLTPDARYIAFLSTATNLVPGVRTVGDVYVHDRLAGTNIWASRDMRARLQSVTGQTNGVAYDPVMSADGRFLVYGATHTSPPANVYSGLILRYGLEAGVTDLIHTNAAISIPLATETRHLDITPDGGLVAFVANSNGVSGATTCILVWNAASGSLVLASGNLTNRVINNTDCASPRLDSTGQFVTFLSSATGLVTNEVSGNWHLYSRDLQEGVTTLVNAGLGGLESSLSSGKALSLSADARFIAFESEDTSFIANDSNRALDVLVRDLIEGTNELISVHHPALVSFTPNGPSSTFSPSADGRWVAFASDATNLTPDDTNGWRDVFVADLAAGTNVLVSISTNGFVGSGLSYEPVISGDGRYVAFTSTATNLAAGDANRTPDVFVRDLQTGITLLASRRANGTGAGNSNSHSPVLSADGRWLLFRSQAKDLAAGTFSGLDNLFLRDLPLGTNWALTTLGLTAAAMTPDGRFVAFVGRIAGSTQLYVWDSQLRARVFTNTTTTISNVVISADGNRLAYHTSTELRLVDRSAPNNWLVSTLATASRPMPRFSADGNWLAYSRYVAPWHQVFLYDVQNRTERPISRAPDGAAGSGGHSDLPELTPDGRFVVYRTLTTNIIAGTKGILRQIVLYDRQTDVNTLVSASRFNGTPANDHTVRAVFSAEGHMLFLQSWASDLTTGDFNFTGDGLATIILSALILPPAAPGEGPWLSWPALQNGNYRVQFKNDFSDPTWEDLPGTPARLGVRAWLQDTTPTNALRLYRIVAQ